MIGSVVLIVASMLASCHLVIQFEILLSCPLWVIPVRMYLYLVMVEWVCRSLAFPAKTLLDGYIMMALPSHHQKL